MRWWKRRRLWGEAGDVFWRKKRSGIRAEFRARDAMMLLDPDLSIQQRIQALIEGELAEARIETDCDLRDLDAFRAALVDPFETRVNFSGGMVQICWTVTRTDGAYRVVFMPRAGYFSLCVESDFGPLDIGVHGAALGCYGSV